MSKTTWKSKFPICKSNKSLVLKSKPEVSVSKPSSSLSLIKSIPSSKLIKEYKLLSKR